MKRSFAVVSLGVCLATGILRPSEIEGAAISRPNGPAGPSPGLSIPGFGSQDSLRPEAAQEKPSISWNSPEAVATVNGEPITVREFHLHVRRNRAMIVGYFRARHHAVDSSDFWARDFAGEMPSDVLKKKALDSAVRTKVQQLLAKEKGVVADTDYGRFIERWERENERRRRAAENNQIIYGPMRYSETVYYNHVANNMVLRLKERLGNQEFHLSEEKMREVYMADRAAHYRNGDIPFEEARWHIREKYIDEQYESLVAELVTTAGIDICRDVYVRIRIR